MVCSLSAAFRSTVSASSASSMDHTRNCSISSGSITILVREQHRRAVLSNDLSFAPSPRIWLSFYLRERRLSFVSSAENAICSDLPRTPESLAPASSSNFLHEALQQTASQLRGIGGWLLSLGLQFLMTIIRRLEQDADDHHEAAARG